MTTYGVTPNGFVKKTYEVIYAEMRESIETSLGSDVDTSEDSDLGQILAITSEQRANDWDVMEAVYYSQYCNFSSDISLDNAAQNTGHTRDPATFSFTTLRFSGAEGAVVPAGSLGGTETGIQAATLAEAVIPAAGFIDVGARAVNAGNVFAAAGSMTILPSPILNVTGVTNTTDLDDGQDRESDQDFRLRRAEELQTPGTSAVEGIRNALLELDYMLKALVVENPLDTTDSEGRPPHSFESFVSTSLPGGIDDPANAAEKAEVAEAILKSGAAGIQTYGDLSETVQDSQGFDVEVFFSEPTPVDIIVVCTLVGNTDPAEGPLYPDDGDDQVKQSLLDYGEELELGQDVWFNRVYEAISKINGVKEITALTVNGGTSNITIESTEVSFWDTANFTINS